MWKDIILQPEEIETEGFFWYIEQHKWTYYPGTVNALIGDVNHDISIFGYWIFDSNHEKELMLNRKSLDIIYAPSIGEEKFTKF